MSSQRQMRTLSATIFAVVLTLCLVPIIQQVHATTFGSVYTTDTSNNPKISFALGETVRVHWIADNNLDIHILVQSQDGSYSTLQTETSISGYFDISGLAAGLYKVTFAGNPPTIVAVGTFFVIPEFPLGAIMATGAGFAAFGTYKIIKPKNKIAKMQRKARD